MNKIITFKETFSKIDETVNAWLSENPNIDIINIRQHALFGENCTSWYTDVYVMIHYRSKETISDLKI